LNRNSSHPVFIRPISKADNAEGLEPLLETVVSGTQRASQKQNPLSISEGELVTNVVFVYGSMSEGMVHFDKIKSAVVSVQPACVTAAAYQLPSGYPVIMKEGSEVIPGHLVELSSSDLMMPLLDEFFGVALMDPAKGLHMREEVDVTAEQLGAVKAWIYFVNPKKLPTQAKKIESHQWEEALKSPKFVDQLSERQKTYIRRLGKITGREVVPIDLPLYRELMSLELIVDKGRRLALSKFGQEVYRYLGEGAF
jgi:gamma-glutamylcyclotransferase (GGCT)/AIG2-like uncharacterized protein YtfP